MESSWIDVSVDLEPGMVTYEGDLPYEEYEFKTHERDGVHIMRVLMETHTGTHVDAPYHMIPNGKKISEFDLDRFMGKALVVEVHGDEIGEDAIPPSCPRVVLFKTKNSYLYDRFHGDYAYLTLGAARKLVEHKVKVVGIDYLSVERFGSTGFDVHKELMSNDVAIVEGLNLAQAKPGIHDFVCLPLKMGQDGAPCRAAISRGTESDGGLAQQH
ncbi:MAG TPA: cyclase family protein [Thermoprotei archaeon]|nr:cyclase family protein [Thermoprotei archaeon]